MATKGRVVGVISNIVTIEADGPVAQNEICYITTGGDRLMAEVIKVAGREAYVQVFESTRGMKVGAEAEFTGRPLEVTLGPGMLSKNYDGLQNDLDKMEGVFLRRGQYTDPLDRDRKWHFVPLAKAGDSVEGSAIVYTRSRRNTKEAAEQLQTKGFTATFYHAGLNDAEKDLRQREWQTGKTRVMVATNAFGMGIDKPDVRIVTHLDIPDSIESYFQEAGRAGRDGQQAYAVLLYQKYDRTRLMKRIPETFPDKDDIRKVYEHICYYCQMAMGDGYQVTREFNLEEFCRNFKHFPVQTNSALHLLERAGYIEYTEEQENASRLHFLLRRDELYRIHELCEEQEQLIQWILRSYGGLFSDYVFIDERRLATLSGIPDERVYQHLLALTRARILHYIPRKRTPYVTFTRKRVETDRIVLPPEVYDDRKKGFKERIEAMLHYAEEMDFCRSKVLLHYFGEEDSPECGQCDVCRRRQPAPTPDIETLILEKLKDGKKHTVGEMEFPGIPRDKTAQSLKRLMEEETVLLSDGMLHLPGTTPC